VGYIRPVIWEDTNKKKTKINMNSTTNNCNPSKSYYQEDKLDLDSWFSVTQVDYEKLIEQYSFDNLFKAFGKTQLKILDVGCGTAKFPSLLDHKINSDIHSLVDLLDISEYCLQVAQKQYDNLKHFSAGKTYLSATENIHKSVQKIRDYDIIWAIHSLCTIGESQMENVYFYYLDLLQFNGKFLIYQLAKNSSYYKLDNFYLSHYPEPNRTTPFLSSEDIKQTLDVLGITYETISLHFTHRINSDCQNILEIYLKKCVLDNNVDVLNFLKPILQECFDEESNQYKFDQVVDLLIIEKSTNIRR
jgi:SAM-dependent methyltransferase